VSYRAEQFLQFKPTRLIREGVFIDDMSNEDITNLCLEVLRSGTHGFCFSLYEEGQKPGDIISETQIRRRLRILKRHTKWVRSFSTTEGNELIPVIAKEFGMKTLVGAWLGSDQEKNESEVSNLIKLANDGYVDIAAVGNEVLYRGDLSEDELLDLIKRVKTQITQVPVGYVDAYYEFVQRPNLTELCDVILSNCYPYWEGTNCEDALGHLKHMYNQSRQAANGKKVIITETGWPSHGQPLGNANPSLINAMKYFANAQLWAIDEGIDLFYFSSFDEDWKADSEGEVGAYWGVWDKNENIKFI